MEYNALSSALEKIRGGEGSAVTTLLDGEAQALSDYLSTRSGEPGQTESDQLLLRHIRIVLQERATRMSHSDSETPYQRTNLTLRAAIDLFLNHDYSSVLQKDVELLRETHARLQAIEGTSESSPNHLRLSKLIAECLEAFASWQAEQQEQQGGNPTAAESAKVLSSPPPPGAETAGMSSFEEAREFLSAAGTRESVATLEGIPFGANVRVVLHDGDLRLRGELTDEFLVDVRGGAMEVDGGIFGFATVDGDIKISGSVQGGWLYSRNGNIHVDRILAGSVLIAPRGEIVAGSVESPRVVYCGLDFCAGQGLRSGVYFARNVRVAEGIRNAQINLRGSLTAQSIESSGQDDSPGIQFRLAHTSLDFGRPLQEGHSSSLRNFGRLWYRSRVAAAMQAYLEMELLAIQRFRIFAMQSGGTDITALTPIRHVQIESALLPVLLTLGEGLKELLVLGENIGHGMESALVTTGVDESTTCLAMVAKEIKLLCRSYVRDKEVLEAPCRHIASFAKKLKDTVRLSQPVDKLLYDFDFRMDEWRAQIANASADLDNHHQAMAALLGPTVWQVTAPERLTALLGRMIHAAEEGGKLPRNMQLREMNAMREHVEQHIANQPVWRAQLEALRGEYEEVLAALDGAISLVVSEGAEEAVHAAHFGPGVRIQTLASIKKSSGASGAMVFVTGGAAGNPTTIRMRNLRLFPEG